MIEYFMHSDAENVHTKIRSHQRKLHLSSLFQLKKDFILQKVTSITTESIQYQSITVGAFGSNEYLNSVWY